MRYETPFVLVFPLPDAKDVMQCETTTLLCAYALMKLAGQITMSVDDLNDLAHHYAGFTVGYDPKEKTFVSTLRTRPSEYPPLPRGA